MGANEISLEVAQSNQWDEWYGISNVWKSTVVPSTYTIWIKIRRIIFGHPQINFFK